MVTLKNIESQAVLLPDIEGDSVPDLLVATLPADEVKLPPIFGSLVAKRRGEWETPSICSSVCPCSEVDNS